MTLRELIESFDTIEAISPEVRGIAERNWVPSCPHGGSPRYRTTGSFRLPPLRERKRVQINKRRVQTSVLAPF